MFGKRIFTKCIIVLFFLSNVLIAGLRDPFKPVKKVQKKELSLNAILSVGEKKYASVTYNDKNYTLSNNENIEHNYKVKEIKNNELVLYNLETGQEKIILLPN